MSWTLRGVDGETRKAVYGCATPSSRLEVWLDGELTGRLLLGKPGLTDQALADADAERS